MKPILTLLFGILLLSCAPRGGYLTQAQVADTAFVAGKLDTLTAYRKHPGSPRNVAVQGYYRKDSTYVPPHVRTARRTKAQMGAVSQ